ncbi:hypothetical protein QBC38DRAFT_230656 [Podospora fimiseda]|uniref:RBR-type E3 ubiquitin transferase n=1 Tax=Podospora fimiseda TaxID=252190 RepID=A0AAN7BN57_9PEZI|nr:hypothetical protein QBC38DRAFT_230656 [Podospora fimiseda]
MDIDAETVRLLVQLQLEDLEALKTSPTVTGKGKARDDSDIAASADAAIELYRAELQEFAQIFGDHAMCVSLAQAVETDAPIVTAAAQEEEQAVQDRLVATALSRGEDISILPIRPIVPEASTAISDADTVNSDATTLVPDAETQSQPESSIWATTRSMPHATFRAPLKFPKKKRTCVACAEKYIEQEIVLCPPPCNHGYCQDCLESLFRASITDETLFPPRCCGQPIPLDTSQALLPRSLVQEFTEKRVEFETPNRIYCFQPTCSAFIPPNRIEQTVAACPKCFCRTCTICKGVAHPASVECPDDPSVQQMNELADQMGWQKCRQCGRVIELNTGCNHITCPCSAQFCYACGGPWKQCSCPQWQEELLYDRANAIVNRNLAGQHQQLGGRQRAALVEQERRHLIENHECQHRSWTSRFGRHRCEECRDWLPTYIYECQQCRIMACRRCRYNRLA